MLGLVVKRLPSTLTPTICESTILTRPSRLVSHKHHFPSIIEPFAIAAPVRSASSSSSSRWVARQTRDSYARDAKVAGLKSRAAWKLLEINDKYRLFRRGDTVVDLGYAPGSWSQVAANRTQPGGRVVGIDVIPAQPPKGVSTLQGDFLSPEIRQEVRNFVLDPMRGRPRERHQLMKREGDEEEEDEGMTEEELREDGRGVVEKSHAGGANMGQGKSEETSSTPQKTADLAAGRVVNVVLSDMYEPWPLTTSTWIRSVSNPWRRMMNTSGMPFRDHAGSMVSSTSWRHIIPFVWRWLIELSAGSLPGCVGILLRHTHHRRTFSVQVLSGR